MKLNDNPNFWVFIRKLSALEGQPVLSEWPMWPADKTEQLCCAAQANYCKAEITQYFHRALTALTVSVTSPF